MATPSGQIGLSDVNVENALPSTSVVTMNDTVVRTLAGAPFATPGTMIGMNDLRGKTKPPTMWTGTISTPQANLNLLTWATANGYPGTGAVQVTVAPGVYVYADGATGATVYGMNIPAGFPGTVSVINNGFIMGQGGHGGGAVGPWAPNAIAAPNIILAAVGQPAINIAKPVTITNNSYIAGGGGGGGGVAPMPITGTNRTTGHAGGGGAGGGRGGPAARTSVPGAVNTVAGGAGGAIGVAGATGVTNSPIAICSLANGGGGGGRILPGVSGTTTVGQGGAGGGAGGNGSGVVFRSPNPVTIPIWASLKGGGGGGWGAAGANGNSFPFCVGPTRAGTGGAGGSAGTAGCGSPTGLVAPGQPGGRAINLNANTVTWGATGTVYGSVA